MNANVAAQVQQLVVEKFSGVGSVRLSASLLASLAAVAAATWSAPSPAAAGVEPAEERRTVPAAAVAPGRKRRGSTRSTRPLEPAVVGVTSPSSSSAPEVAAAEPRAPAPVASTRRSRAQIDRHFVRHFMKLLRIAFPALRSRQGAYIAILTALLLLRTWLSLKISSVTGSLAKTMVAAELRPFAMAIATLALWSIPASLVNSGLRYVTSLLQVTFRLHLSKHYHRRYLSHASFFKTVGLGAVDTVEQRIAQDIQKWSDEAADIYSTLFKPVIDIALFSNKVAEYGGYKGPMLIISYYAVITFLIRVLAPNFALLSSEQQKKDAELRAAHTRLLAYAEEVTLSNGEGAVRTQLDRLFLRTNVLATYTAFMRAKNNLFEGILVKYGSTMVGYAVCAISIFSPEASKKSASELTGLYIHTSQLLVNLARAVGQLILTYKSVSSLAGYTDRVYQLEEGLAAVERRARQQQQQQGQLNDEEEWGAAAAPDHSSPPGSTAVAAASGARGGVVAFGNGIRFVDVPLISPVGVVLVEKLSFYVEPGMNLLIVGPNGCGKSSTFRLLGELWPLHGGRIEKPGYEHLYYVPQRPYMSSGTLRDQVIYPLRAKDLKVGESELFKCLQMAGLEALFDKPQISWDARLQWSGEALSSGEKQKLAMARLFFHRPRFAILDECSSQVDLDVEQQLYTQCRELGITIITIAHRRSVWRNHNWILRFDGNGGYMFSPLRFTDDDDMVLTGVVSASDPALCGSEVRVCVMTQQVSVHRGRHHRHHTPKNPAPKDGVVTGESSA